MKKRIIAFLLILAFAVCCVQALAIDLYVDRNKLEPDSPPVIVNDRTLVPLRTIFEALGAEVSWEGETRTATAVKDWIHVIITIDSPTAYVNGEANELDVPAQIIEGRTMVPIRFVSEALNAKVTWVPEKQSVYVNTAVPANAEFVIFCILTGVGLGINEAIMAAFLAFTRISYILCKVIAALIVSLWNYFSRKRWLDSDPTALPPSRSERDGA